MLVQADVIYLGHEEKSFKGQNGEMVDFKKANFIAIGDSSPLSLSVVKDCDVSARKQLSKCRIVVNLYSDKAGYLRGRVEDITWQDDVVKDSTSTSKHAN